MICAARFKPPLLLRRVAFASIFLSSAAAFADEALWKMYFEAGTEAYQKKRYAIAETMFLAARTEGEGFGLNDVRLASTLFQLARIYNDENEYEKAELHYRRAIEIWETVSAPASIDFANALNELGNLYYQNNRGRDAEKLYRQALKIREDRNGPAHPDLIIPLTNLAGNLRSQNKYEEAEPVYKRAQVIAEKYLDSDDLKVADVLRKDATNLLDEGKYSEAELLYRRALDIMDKNRRSEDDPVVISSIERLAVTLFDQGKFSEARPLAERAIRILEKNDQSKDLAAPLTFLGDTCKKLGDYEVAERAYTRALDKVGIDNSAALRTLENYSRMLRDLKREEKAQELEAHIRKIQATAGAVEEKR